MDPFIYRECRATITARIPDTPDADAHPDRVLVQGRGTAHPQFQGGSVVFTEIGEYAIPQPIPVVIVGGELLVEVLAGDESIETQALFLPVTVDERANQNWSWRLTFDFLTLGEYGEEVKHPPLSFPVEAGDGPLEISTVATPTIKTNGFVTRGERGFSVTSITAGGGELVFEWEDGKTDTIPMPDSVPGPPPTVEWDGPHLVVEGERSPDLRGPNTMPADEFVAGTVADPGSLTGGALRDGFIEGRATADEVQLGPDLVTSSGWVLGNGWTGSLAEGFAHGEGGGTLTWGHSGLDTAKTYLLRFTVDSPTANSAFDPEAFTLTIGGQSMSPIYEGGGTVTSYRRAFTPTSQDPLVLTPLSSSRVMTILGVSLQEVTAPAPATSVWRTSTGQVGAEFRTTGSSGSQFLGTDSGRFHVGSLSVGVGSQALMDDVSGFFNVAVGARALQHAQRTSRNVAVGFRSLENNIMADRNVAVGPFSGHTLTTGNENTLVGVDTMWQTENSSRNVAVGLYALDRADNVHNSIGIGRHSLKRANGGVENIGIGSYALKSVQGNRNVAIGEFAAEEMTTATSTVAIGGRALRYSSTAAGQIGIGYATAQHANGPHNIAVGQRALEGEPGLTTGSHNIAIGLNAGQKVTTGSNNILIGPETGTLITSGSHNILIGDGVNQPVTGDHVLNIGHALRGDLLRRNIGVDIETPTARLHLPAGDGSPRSAPLKIAPGGVLLETPEPGALEYVAGKLYFTTGNGRLEIAFVEGGA